MRYLVPCLTAMFGLSLSLSAQIVPQISTCAGTGNPGPDGVGGPPPPSTGDGGLATQAGLGYPWYITTDPAGNVYFYEDGENGRVRRIDADTGIITTVLGGGEQSLAEGIPAAAVRIDFGPMAIDASGNLFFGNSNTIWRVDSGTGLLSRYAGGNPTTQFQPVLFFGVPVSVNGQTTVGLQSGDGGPATAAVLDGPSYMLFDPSGNLVFCSGFEVRKIDRITGIINTVAGTPAIQFHWPSDGLGHYEPDEWVLSGVYSPDGGLAANTGLSGPASLAFDSAGNLFIFDGDIEFDYSVDPATHTRIRRVDAATGIITAYAGSGANGYSGDGGPALQARINGGDGLAMDRAGNLYFADASTGVIRRVDGATGVITTIAGTPFVSGYAGDGGPATAALFNFCGPIALDPAGDLYISDWGNWRIRKITGLSPDAPPTAVAGPDQSIHARTLVTLDGSASFDDNTPSASLAYSWSFVSVPAGSTASLTSPTAAVCTFTPDFAGTYEVQLVVRDGLNQASQPSVVMVSSTNLPPAANAGPDQVVVIGSLVTLSGAASTDPESDPLTYQWNLTLRPAGSAALLAGSQTVSPFFIPDVPGTYDLSLVVDDGLGPSLPASVSVTAITGQQFAENSTMSVIATASALPASSVTSTGNQNAYTTLLHNAIRSIQSGNVTAARQQLQDAISRTDGCVLRGRPDSQGAGRDWILDCNAQTTIYNELLAAFNALQ